MKENWDVLGVLRHSRHDWLNRIQLIKGYLQTGQQSQVEDVMNKVMAEALNEAKISSLHSPSFAEFVITYNWKPRGIVLDYEILGDPCSLKQFDELLVNWLQEFLDKLESWVHLYEENFLTLTIEINNDAVRFFFDFRGKLTKKEDLLKWIATSANAGTIRLSSYFCETEESSIEFRLEK